MRGKHVASGRERSGERGTALIVALLVMVIMTMLGIPFLLMGETENRIAENERLSLQALYAAEAGAQMVKRWFDQPMGSTNAVNPPLGAIDRSLRLIDEDGDPATVPVLADGTADHPFYKQYDDAIFENPYRGSLSDTLLGTEDGPDMRIDASLSAAAASFLEGLSATLLADYPGPGLQARISRIDVYAPPTIEKSGSWKRYGIGSASVTAGIYEDRAGAPERLLAERSVRLVFNEIPYGSTTKQLGPLHSCGDVVWDGDFQVHWGTATIRGDADLSSDLEDHTVGLPRANSPPTLETDLVWGFDNGEFGSYVSKIEDEGLSIDDPWVRVLVSGSLDIAPNGDLQPWPLDWAPGALLDDGDFPYQPEGATDGTHSNYFQQVPGVGCPQLSYDTWKKLASSGGRNLHYYVWVKQDKFSENGTGPARTFQEITNGQTGVFFFDTLDRLPPRDDDGDGEFDNLTPGIAMWGGDWGVRGVVYLNAEFFRVDGSHGIDVPFEPPAEPFQDVNENGYRDSTEIWVNLSYPTSLTDYDGEYRVDSMDNYGGKIKRNHRGPAMTERANLWGVLYTNGYVSSSGASAYYGSVIAYQGLDEIYTCSSDPKPHFVWDQTLRETWPPTDWNMPRVVVSRWDTDF
jgi:hypothetical protein